MNSEELLKQLRESVEKQIAAGRPSTEVVFIFLQLQILDKLGTVNSNLIDIKSSVDDLDPHKGTRY